MHLGVQWPLYKRAAIERQKSEVWHHYCANTSSLTFYRPDALFDTTQRHNQQCQNTEGVAICLERCANDLHMIQLMPMPPYHLLLHYNADCFTLFGVGSPGLPAYPGCPGKEAYVLIL